MVEVSGGGLPNMQGTNNRHHSWESGRKWPMGPDSSLQKQFRGRGHVLEGSLLAAGRKDWEGGQRVGCSLVDQP